ncbi:MAG: small multi-drug export protein [Candidatus Omnitrophota bacterium]|nr:MAG: small multi-drug export protein [Candidatus Omnitrophota bacterium]
MLAKILILILVTFIPALELRASIPLGILSGQINIFSLRLQGFGLNFILVFAICVISNIILGILVYFFLDKFVKHLMHLKLFAKYYNRKVKKTQKKIGPYVEKYGTLGISMFIGLPIPGSGSYTGALGAYLLGLGYKKFIAANIIGVIAAGVIVTMLTLTGIGFFQCLIPFN